MPIVSKTNFLPLTKSIILGERKNHLYPFLISIEYMTDTENINIDKYSLNCVWFINRKYFSDARKKSCLSYHSFDKYAQTEDLILQDEFICLMPLNVWTKFKEFLYKQHSRSWNSWTKLFCYVYFQCSTHIGCAFTHSREQFQLALDMQAADISAKLIALENAGFIERSNYCADQGIARTYFLPREFWTNYRDYELSIHN